MNGARYQFLSGTRLSGDQDIAVRGGHPADQVVDTAHRFTVADQVRLQLQVGFQAFRLGLEHRQPADGRDGRRRQP